MVANGLFRLLQAGVINVKIVIPISAVAGTVFTMTLPLPINVANDDLSPCKKRIEPIIANILISANVPSKNPLGAQAKSAARMQPGILLKNCLETNIQPIVYRI